MAGTFFKSLIKLCLISILAGCPQEVPPPDKPDKTKPKDEPPSPAMDAGQIEDPPPALDAGAEIPPNATDAGIEEPPESTDAGTEEPPESADAGTEDSPAGTDAGTGQPPPATDAGIEAPPASTDAGTAEELDSGSAAIPSALPGCDVGDEWVIALHSVVAQDDGCQNGGGAAIGDATHRYVVIDDGNGGLAAQLTEPSSDNLDHFETVLSFTSSENTCHLQGHMEFGINFPPDGDGDIVQFVLSYDYNLSATDSIVTGNGTGTTKQLLFPDPGNLDQATATAHDTPCSEPLEFNGTIETD